MSLSSALSVAALWICRTCGRAGAWLAGSWRLPLLWLLAGTAAVWLWEQGDGWIASGKPLAHWWRALDANATLPGLQPVLGVLAAFLLAKVVWESRRRVVVAEFVDHASGSDKPVTRGMGALLVTELARLRELYQVADGERAIPTLGGASRPIEATITVGDLSESLKSAVSAESKFSVGPITFPIGALLALVARTVQGPQVIGSLHREQGQIVLAAQVIGRGPDRSWRVVQPFPSDLALELTAVRVSELVSELAGRIFTDLALDGAFRYEAVAAFTEGLRAYRACLRTAQDRKLNLSHAERCFIRARGADNRFDLAYYDLGLVYEELQRADAAETAFTEAIVRNPDRWEAYYALALVHFRRGERGKRRDYEQALRLCQRLGRLRMRPADAAMVAKLEGLALAALGQGQNAVHAHARATRLAWRALCRAEAGWGGGTGAVPHARKMASDCLQGLAHACLAATGQAADRGRTRRMLRRARSRLLVARHLTPSSSGVHRLLGDTCARQGDHGRALAAFRSATRIAPGDAELWALLAGAHTDAGNPELARAACRIALEWLDCRAEDSVHVLALIAAAQRAVGDAAGATATEGRTQFYQRVDGLGDSGEASVVELERILDDHRARGCEWEAFHAAFALGRALMGAGRHKEAEERFSEALEMPGRYETEIRRHGIRAYLARSLRLQGNPARALQEAELALNGDPLSWFERGELGEALQALNDYDRAQAAWETALLWRPDFPDFHVKIGIALVRSAGLRTDPEGHGAVVRRAAEHLRKALELFDTGNSGDIAWTHFWLGRLHLEVREYEAALRHFSVAEALVFQVPLTKFYLGVCWLWSNDSNEARGLFEEAQVLLERLLAEGKPGTDVLDGGGEWSVSALLAWCLWGRAYALADRDVNLPEAADLIQKGEEVADRVRPASAQNRVRSALASCEGWILLKLDQADLAIARLEYSLSLGVHAETYLNLALAYEQKARVADATDPPAALAWTARARTFHAQAVRTDTRKQNDTPLTELLVRLDRLEEQVRANIVDTARLAKLKQPDVQAPQPPPPPVAQS